ncbi:hypothetical protein Hypma_012521 [Hypsizygus marmoreus]|uniref:Uncharacterized protein n=1 Tax=Hypsizygus marmoreus TaxID=39966 RepID=A0A369JJ06_HYPMA|nr:hypothetical protein Hypma_012521 [Hypsizygus marmoreus]
MEEVIPDDLLRLPKLALRLLEVKIDIQLLQEMGEGFMVLVFLRLDDLDDLPDHQGLAGEDGGSSKVPQDPETRRLDHVEVIEVTGGRTTCESGAEGASEDVRRDVAPSEKVDGEFPQRAEVLRSVSMERTRKW